MSEGIFLTMVEWEALNGLPDQDCRMYVLMRQWMDLASGIVGGRPGPLISYRRFREHMEVQRERGSTAAPTRRSDDSLRASVARLVRFGLIKRVVVKGAGRFVFCYRLLLAKLRPDEEPRVERGHVTDGAQQVKATSYVALLRERAARLRGRPARDEPQPSGVTRIDKTARKSGGTVDKLASMPLADPWRLAAEQALGPLLLGHELLCPHLPSAFDRLAAVMRVRTVSHAELGRCLAIARRMRKVVSIPAYTVGIVLDGTELRRLQRAGGGKPAVAQVRPAVEPFTGPLVQTRAVQRDALSAARRILSRVGAGL